MKYAVPFVPSVHITAFIITSITINNLRKAPEQALCAAVFTFALLRNDPVCACVTASKKPLFPQHPLHCPSSSLHPPVELQPSSLLLLTSLIPPPVSD